LQNLKIIYIFSNVLSLGSLNIQHFMLQYFSNSLNATLKQQDSMLQFFSSSLNATLKQQEPLLVSSIDLFIYRKPSDMCVFLYSFIVSYMFSMSLFLWSFKVNSRCVMWLQVLCISLLLPPLAYVCHLFTPSNHYYLWFFLSVLTLAISLL